MLSSPVAEDSICPFPHHPWPLVSVPGSHHQFFLCIAKKGAPKPRLSRLERTSQEVTQVVGSWHLLPLGIMPCLEQTWLESRHVCEAHIDSARVCMIFWEPLLSLGESWKHSFWEVSRGAPKSRWEQRLNRSQGAETLGLKQ